jgi:hypothetical protein
VLNYRIGLDAVSGLIPGLDNAAGILLSSRIVRQAIRLGASSAILMRMALNVPIEAILGVVPLVGDGFGATFKGNMRNVRLLNLVVSSGRAASKSTEKSAFAAVIGTLIGLILLIGGTSIAIVTCQSRLVCQQERCAPLGLLDRLFQHAEIGITADDDGTNDRIADGKRYA